MASRFDGRSQTVGTLIVMLAFLGCARAELEPLRSPSSATAFTNGGSAFGSPAFLGLTGVSDLNIGTSGISHVTISATGQVGIGTTNPTSKLSVDGVIESRRGGLRFPDATTQLSASVAVGLMIVQNVVPAGGAEASVAGTWVTRALNTVNYNSITGASLISNQITLPAGTFLIEARAPAHSAGSHTAVWYNKTDGTTDLYGSDGAIPGGSATMVDSCITGVVVISEPKVFEVRHITSSTLSSGLGRGISFGPYVLTSVKITKIR